LRGLKVALIDKGDFGGATSANSLKTIHGGLRYLQQLDLLRMRESIRERMVLMRIAPHLVHPLPVLMPTYGCKLKSRPALLAALLANDIVGFDRNRLSDPQKRIPNGHTMSSRELKELIPGYDKHNLNGGALWFDCQCVNTERLLLAYVISAAKKGADAANYVKATGLLLEGARVTGIRAQDVMTGDYFDIRSRLVVNESGPWVDEVLSGLNSRSPRRRFIRSTAMNLVVNRKVADRFALGLSGPFRHVFADGSESNGFRILFFSPWRGRTIIGTNHRPHAGGGREYKITEREILDFLADINRAYPAAEIRRDEVAFFSGGFLPMKGIHPRTGEVQLVRHYKIHDHALQDGIEGLITVVGVKYTTARDVARRTVDLIAARIGQKTAPSRTATTPLYGGEIERFDDFLKGNLSRRLRGHDEKVMAHLSRNYGSALGDILGYEKDGGEPLGRIPGSDEVLRAEVLHGVREEMALNLADVVFRRTDLGSAGHPGEAALVETASLMARELGWNDAKREAEIAAVNRMYIPA
jgi:glycerol-3-phosphate dehydrogenase